MAGQAIIRIGDKEWFMDVATLPWELSQGLGGITEMPPASGMLFDTGVEQTIQVTTVPMLFSLDIAFFSEDLAITELDDVHGVLFPHRQVRGILGHGLYSCHACPAACQFVQCSSPPRPVNSGGNAVPPGIVGTRRPNGQAVTIAAIVRKQRVARRTRHAGLETGILAACVSA